MDAWGCADCAERKRCQNNQSRQLSNSKGRCWSGLWIRWAHRCVCDDLYRGWRSTCIGMGEAFGEMRLRFQGLGLHYIENRRQLEKLPKLTVKLYYFQAENIFIGAFHHCCNLFATRLQHTHPPRPRGKGFWSASVGGPTYWLTHLSFGDPSHGWVLCRLPKGQRTHRWVCHSLFATLVYLTAAEVFLELSPHSKARGTSQFTCIGSLINQVFKVNDFNSEKSADGISRSTFVGMSLRFEYMELKMQYC
jgi:hypothetical protein